LKRLTVRYIIPTYMPAPDKGDPGDVFREVVQCGMIREQVNKKGSRQR